MSRTQDAIERAAGRVEILAGFCVGDRLDERVDDGVGNSRQIARGVLRRGLGGERDPQARARRRRAAVRGGDDVEVEGVGAALVTTA